MVRGQRDAEAVRITTASSSKAADIAARQKRYLLSMSLRSGCFIGAVIVGPGLLCWFLIAGALVLPYIAVVLANISTTRTDGFALLDTTHRPELMSGAPAESIPVADRR
ncbi:MAG: DUF3099 domain-containing protein [Nocardioides sp.]|nr:DUF3099 domain-containing protein [Nocardioides sp.]